MRIMGECVRRFHRLICDPQLVVAGRQVDPRRCDICRGYICAALRCGLGLMGVSGKCGLSVWRGG